MKKRKDGRYQTSVVVGYGERGRPIRRYVYGRTVKETEEKAAEIRQQASHGVVLKKDITIEELVNLWMALEKQPVVKTQTYTNLCSQARKLAKYLGDVKAKDLSAGHIYDMREKLLELEQVDSYNKLLSMLRAALNFGIRNDYVIRNVTLGLPRLKDPNKAVKRSFTAFEKKAIEGADLDPQERLFVDLLRFSGIRRGEALALTIGDIDIDRHEVTISKNLVSSTNSIEDTTKTAAGCRIIPLPRVFFERNGSYLRSRQPYEPLWMSSVYKPLSSGTFWTRWNRISAKIFPGGAPDDFTPHLFRHNYASELYESGLMKNDLKAAQYILGHVDTKTTMDVYTHFDKDKIDRTYIDDFYRNDVKMMSAIKKEA